MVDVACARAVWQAPVVTKPTRPPFCDCLAQWQNKTGPAPLIHGEPENRSAPVWGAAQELMRLTAERGGSSLEPSSIPLDDWLTLIAVPRSIGILSRVKKVVFYGSRLRRLPPEIGQMTASVYGGHSGRPGWLHQTTPSWRSVADASGQALRLPRVLCAA